MGWLAWTAALSAGTAVWLWSGSAPAGARLRDPPSARGPAHARADDDVQSGSRGVSVQLASIIASLQGGAEVMEALRRQFDVPGGADVQGGLVAQAAVTDCNGDCDPERIAELLRERRLSEETDAQIREAARGMCAAYETSRRLGCPAARCFEAVREAYLRLRMREDLKRNAFAVPRSTVRVLLGLPAVTVVLGELLGANPIGVLFGSWQGLCCLTLGSVCYAAGAAWMHRLMVSMAGGSP